MAAPKAHKKIAPTSGVPQSKRTISLFMLAMMNTAVVVGLEGLPEVGGFGLSLVFYYAIFTLIYFLPVGLVAGTGLLASVLGICFLFVPPEMQYVTINTAWFTPIIVLAFAGIICTPFILYKKM